MNRLKTIIVSGLRTLIKTFPWLENLAINSYNFLYKNNSITTGKNNNIKIDFQGSIPDLKNVIFKIYGHENYIHIGSNVKIFNTKIEIHGNNNKIIIEDNCQIKNGYLWIEDFNCELQIGARTTFEAELHLHISEPNSKITIGQDCMFAYGVFIRCADSHSIIDLNTNDRINYAENIHIGDRVWVATRAQILKGVNIGNDSIIAAGSIVTKNVPNNSIVAGIPAQVKKTDVTWNRKKILKNFDVLDKLYVY